MTSLSFILKKILSFSFTPLGMLLGCCLLVFLLKRRWPNVARFLLFCGLLMLFVLAVPIVSKLVIHPLEACYYQYADAGQLTRAGVKNIVVLGAGVRRGEYSVIDQINGEGLTRVLEGVRLYKAMPQTKLWLAGGGFAQQKGESTAMLALALALGVPEHDIILEKDSWDTRGQAISLGKMLGSQPFALVTSAWHMPRSMLLFEQLGKNPLPAPTDFRSRDLVFSYDTLLPRAGSLRLSELAFKEYLGYIHTSIFRVSNEDE